MQKIQISDIVKICLFPFLVYIISHSLNLLYNPEDVWWWPNILFHFSGGFSMAVSGYFILDLAKNYNKIKTANIFIDFILILNFVMAMAVVWEFYELISDTYFFTHSQLSNADTMNDLIMGGVGALFFCLFWLLRRIVAKLAK